MNRITENLNWKHWSDFKVCETSNFPSLNFFFRFSLNSHQTFGLKTSQTVCIFDPMCELHLYSWWSQSREQESSPAQWWRPCPWRSGGTGTCGVFSPPLWCPLHYDLKRGTHMLRHTHTQIKHKLLNWNTYEAVQVICFRTFTKIKTPVVYNWLYRLKNHLKRLLLMFKHQSKLMLRCIRLSVRETYKTSLQQ